VCSWYMKVSSVCALDIWKCRQCVLLIYESVVSVCSWYMKVSSECALDICHLPFQKSILQSSACVAALKNESCHVTYMNATCHVGRFHVKMTYLRSGESSAQYITGSCHRGMDHVTYMNAACHARMRCVKQIYLTYLRSKETSAHIWLSYDT